MSLNCPNCGASLGLNLAVLSPSIEPQVTPIEAQTEPQSRVGGVRSSRARFNYPDPNFKAFWKAYPRKVGKASAYSKWLIVIREIEPQIVIDAAAQYAKDNAGVEPQYLKYPEGWLSAGRWDDEQPTPPKPSAAALLVGSPEWNALNRPWEARA